jgi:VanZ family protein
MVIIAGSPLAGELRAAIAAVFPGQSRAIIGGMVAVAIAIALLTAAVRIRRLHRRGRGKAGNPVPDRRGLRYFALGTALLAGILFARALNSGDPDTDVVEAFHFVEYGILTLLFYLAWRPIDDVSVLVLPLLAGLLIGTLDEWFQWFIPSRVGELRDVLLDAAAVACGLLFSVGVDPPGRFTRAAHRGSAMRMGTVAVAVVFAFALFFQAAFLGFDVRDPRIGVFRSRYTAAQLESAARDRSARWRAAPPVAAGRVSREDQYLTEALWHVRRRNEAAAVDDVFAAWRENRILEAFYAPVLEPSSFPSRAGLRWPEPQRLDIERRAQDDGRPYLSGAEPYRIYVWPKSAFWMAVALVIAVTIALSFAAERRSRRLA